MKQLIWIIFAGLSACTSEAEIAVSTPPDPAGFAPNIIVGENSPEDIAALQDWIDESVSVLTSNDFEANLARIAQRYPQVWISSERDVMPTGELIDVLRANDNRRPALWWPKTSVILKGEPATRDHDPGGFGFTGARDASTGAKTDKSGEIELGRLHFARYIQGDVVERSCAINTMTHEISHTLSERRDQFWMHILDSGKDGNPPPGIYEASYLIGTTAQCTWLQQQGRIGEDRLFNCLHSFTDPLSGSRFRSRACNDFPDNTPITPDKRAPL